MSDFIFKYQENEFRKIMLFCMCAGHLYDDQKFDTLLEDITYKLKKLRLENKEFNPEEIESFILQSSPDCNIFVSNK